MADPLTADQRAVWDEMGMGERPTVETDGQTLGQAENMRVDAFRYACGLDGVEPPSEDAVREALRAVKAP